MGIRDLMSFMSRRVQDGKKYIDIAAEIDKYHRENNGKHPSIVVESDTFVKLMYESDHEVLLGGRYPIYNERAVNFLTKLKNMGVNLIFFFPGPSQKDNLIAAKAKPCESYLEYTRILQDIDSGRDLSGDISDLSIGRPLPLLGSFGEIAKSFGEMKCSILNECHLELACLATEIEALAIISNDSDFLIYDGNWRFWCSRELDIEKLTIAEYNRSALREHLSLSNSQMPILATLSGNCIMQYEYLEGFYKRICRGWRFNKLAQYIRKLKSHPNKPKPGCVRYLINMMFPTSKRNEMTDLFYASLKSYDYTQITKSCSNDLLGRVSKDNNRMNYTILADKPYKIRSYYFDLPNSYFMPFYDLIIPLIKRKMGILLQHLNNEKITRTFKCIRDSDAIYQPCEESPIYPEVEVPELMDLLYTPYGEREDLDNIRVNLLCWCVSGNLDPSQILQLPNESLITVLLIFYLCDMKQISLDEADCLLLANHGDMEMIKSIQCTDIEMVDGRTARLAFLFTRMYQSIVTLLYGVGLRHLYSVMRFDGVYFHSLRNKWDEMPANEKSAALQKYENLRIYVKLFDKESIEKLTAACSLK